MLIKRNSPSILTFAVVVAVAVGSAQCAHSPTSPSPATQSVSSISASANSIAAGGTAQVTIRLTLAAPGAGTSVTLSSSTPAVVTVPNSVMVQPGSFTAAFTATAVAVGAATIKASIDSSSQTMVLNVTAQTVALSSIRLSSSTVVGGSWVTGTAVLTGLAPAGGALVVLSASDPLDVADSVTVPAGSSIVQFVVATRQVAAATNGTVNASYGGVSASVILAVTLPTAATASFGVTGDDQAETCGLANGGTTLNCTFDGSTSTSPGTIVAWDWSYGVAKVFKQTTAGPVLSMPAIDCSLVPPPPLPFGATWLPLTVALTVHDSLGNVSAQAIHESRLLPQGACGY